MIPPDNFTGPTSGVCTKKTKEGRGRLRGTTVKSSGERLGEMGTDYS